MESSQSFCSSSLVSLGSWLPLRIALGDTVPLKEYLGRDWLNELVHYDYAFAPGEWRAANARVVDARGKEFPAQLSAVTKHPDGSIQHVQVWFLISLKPGEVTQFKLQPGKSETGSELKVSRVGDRVEINNGLVGARFQLGEKRPASRQERETWPHSHHRTRVPGCAPAASIPARVVALR